MFLIPTGIPHNFNIFVYRPFTLPLKFLLRNLSPTHDARYTLHLIPEPATSRCAFIFFFFWGGVLVGLNRVLSKAFLPLPYHGRLTFRGIIPPLQSVVVQPKVWFTRAGSYELGGWTLETEINTVDVVDPTKSTRKRRYLQKPQLSENMCLIVCDARRS